MSKILIRIHLIKSKPYFNSNKVKLSRFDLLFKWIDNVIQTTRFSDGIYTLLGNNWNHNQKIKSILSMFQPISANQFIFI